MANQTVTWNASSSCYTVDHPDATVKRGAGVNFVINVPAEMTVKFTNWPGKSSGSSLPGNLGAKTNNTNNAKDLSWGIGQSTPTGEYDWDLYSTSAPTQALTMCGGTGDKPSMTVEP